MIRPGIKLLGTSHKESSGMLYDRFSSKRKRRKSWQMNAGAKNHFFFGEV